MFREGQQLLPPSQIGWMGVLVSGTVLLSGRAQGLSLSLFTTSSLSLFVSSQGRSYSQAALKVSLSLIHPLSLSLVSGTVFFSGRRDRFHSAGGLMNFY